MAGQAGAGCFSKCRQRAAEILSYLFGFFLVLFLVSVTVALLISMPAARLANMLRFGGPVALVGIGAALSVAGRAGIGLPLIALGAAMFTRLRAAAPIRAPSGARRSTVRSAMLEMELDHESGDMDGTVLTGEQEGARLSALNEAQLLELLQAVSADGESAALLEAYLDRRMPGWREDAQSYTGAGQGGATGSGPMTKEEAYQILGLAPGASGQDIREAHRRLMKRLHPDSGGSTFLASKINEAKEVLLG